MTGLGTSAARMPSGFTRSDGCRPSYVRTTSRTRATNLRVRPDAATASMDGDTQATTDEWRRPSNVSRMVRHAREAWNGADGDRFSRRWRTRSRARDHGWLPPRLAAAAGVAGDLRGDADEEAPAKLASVTNAKALTRRRPAEPLLAAGGEPGDGWRENERTGVWRTVSVKTLWAVGSGT